MMIDNEPITEEWLLSIGFERLVESVPVYYHRYVMIDFDVDMREQTTYIRLDRARHRIARTRQDVLTFCELLRYSPDLQIWHSTTEDER